MFRLCRRVNRISHLSLRFISSCSRPFSFRSSISRQPPHSSSQVCPSPLLRRHQIPLNLLRREPRFIYTYTYFNHTLYPRWKSFLHPSISLMNATRENMPRKMLALGHNCPYYVLSPPRVPPPRSLFTQLTEW